jgi:hypothetical protein
MPKYTQTFASLASQFKTQDDGVNFTITVDADNRKQAARRLAILLYGRCAVASSTLQPARTVAAPFGPIAIISEEIQWCGENKGSSECGPSFERGFVAGLKQARRLLKAAAPKPHSKPELHRAIINALGGEGMELSPMKIKSLNLPSNPTPECPGCGAAAGMELCHCKPGCNCLRCAKRRLPKRRRTIICTCRGGNTGCPMHGHSDR